MMRRDITIVRKWWRVYIYIYISIKLSAFRPFVTILSLAFTFLLFFHHWSFSFLINSLLTFIWRDPFQGSRWIEAYFFPRNAIKNDTLNFLVREKLKKREKYYVSIFHPKMRIYIIEKMLCNTLFQRTVINICVCIYMIQYLLTFQSRTSSCANES